MAVGDAVYYCTFNSGVQALVARDALYYSDVNTGMPSTALPSDATGLSYVNVGMPSTTLPSDATGLSYVNVGMPLPVALTITRPQQGWGVHIYEAKTVHFYEAASDAGFYVYEGNVS